LKQISLASVYGRIRIAINKAGTQKAWAEEIGVSPQFLNDVLHGKRQPSDRMLKPLGIIRQTTYSVEEEPTDAAHSR